MLQLKLKNDHLDQLIVYNVSSNPFVVIDPISGKLFKKSHVPNVLNGNVVVSVRKISDSPDDAIKKTLRFFLKPSSKNSNSHRLVHQKKTAQLPLNSAPLSTKVELCGSNTPTSTLQILSGNDENLFSLDSSKQVLVLVKTPVQVNDARVVVRTGNLNLCTVC